MDAGIAESPKLQLAPEVIAALEREKAALLADAKESTLLARLKAKQTAEAKPRGGEAEDPRPGALAVYDPVPGVKPAPEPWDTVDFDAPLDLDPETLSNLATVARLAQAEFTAAEGRYNVARLALARAKAELYEHLQRSGIPVA